MVPLRPLLVMLAVVAGIRLLGTLVRRLRLLPAQDRVAPTGDGAPPRMGCCAHCGEYAPESEGLEAEPGVFYCCREHAEAGPAAR